MSRTITVVGIEVEKQVDDFLKNLDGTRQDAPEALLQKLRQMPSLYRRFYLKALTGKSRRGAMKVHCLECAGWNPGEVARCESVSCALWAYRPYRNAHRRPVGTPRRDVSTAAPMSE